MGRTIVYTAIASALCLLIGYPAAYFTARFAGRRKGLFLVLLIAPFWISYMMRMLAWIDLLATHGYVNKVLGWVGISPVNWLGGNAVTVVLGLVYGYIPYLIMVLYAGLDRIDPSLLEAGRDLGHERPALVGEADEYGASIGRGRNAGDEAAALGTIDQTGDAGLVQAQEPRQLVHGRRTVAKHPEQTRLDHRHVVFARAALQRALDQERELRQRVDSAQLPGWHGGLCGHAGTLLDLVRATNYLST